MPWGAIAFPDTKGMNMFLEIESFYLEHYLESFVGIQAILLSGRYGFDFQESFTMFLKK